MSILDFFRRRPAAPVEQRDASGSGLGVSLGGWYGGGAGQAGGARYAENLSTVTACVGAIASSLAMMPGRIYRQTAAARVEVHDHPVCRLIRNGPNPRQSWVDWVEWTIAAALLHGNSVSIILHDSAGRVIGLQPVPWPYIMVSLLPSGRLVYDVTQVTAIWGGGGMPRRYLDTEVLHLRDRSDDGFVGRSRLSRAPAVLEAATGIQTYSTAIWENGATPAGVLKHPGKLNREGKDFLAQAFAQHYGGASNARKTVLLDEGMTWEASGVSPEDAEVLSSRRFSVEELCRIFQVPPMIVQAMEHSNFSTAQQAGTWFAQLSLTPWARKLEAEFTRSVLGEDSEYALEVDLAGLLRGDWQALVTVAIAAVGAKILSVDEAREAAGYGPMPAATVPNV